MGSCDGLVLGHDEPDQDVGPLTVPEQRPGGRGERRAVAARTPPRRGRVPPAARGSRAGPGRAGPRRGPGGGQLDVAVVPATRSSTAQARSSSQPVTSEVSSRAWSGRRRQPGSGRPMTRVVGGAEPVEDAGDEAGSSGVEARQVATVGGNPLERALDVGARAARRPAGGRRRRRWPGGGAPPRRRAGPAGRTQLLRPGVDQRDTRPVGRAPGGRGGWAQLARDGPAQELQRDLRRRPATPRRAAARGAPGRWCRRSRRAPRWPVARVEAAHEPVEVVHQRAEGGGQAGVERGQRLGPGGQGGGQPRRRRAHGRPAHARAGRVGDGLGPRADRHEARPPSQDEVAARRGGATA